MGCLRAVWRVFRAVVERWKLENVRKNWKAQKPRKNQYKSTILAAWGSPGKPLGAVLGRYCGHVGLAGLSGARKIENAKSFKNLLENQ